MTSIEELIRLKVKVAFAEERKRVATGLIAEAGTTVADSGADTGKQRQAKQAQIDTLRGRISALQAKAGTSKDPAKMRQQLDVLNTKVSLATKELGLMKESRKESVE